ncbi:MAG: glycosyltransferase family 4 protein [Candidatus Uhrbacteria bacterium]|nr:glycosyltransferase family 4 protein [Candidatus Uhrbacteria bacterium]
MIVGFDLRSIPSGHPGAGVAHAAIHMARAMEKSIPSSCQIRAYALEGATVPIASECIRLSSGRRSKLVAALREHPCDILFCFSGAVPLFLPVPAIPWVHDLDIFEHPEWFPQSRWKRLLTTNIFLRGLRKAPIVCASTEYAKQQVFDIAKISPDRVIVTGEGGDEFGSAMDWEDLVDARRSARAELASSLKMTRPFVLLFGTFEPRKNAPFILSCWADIIRQLPGIDLVIAGRDGWKMESLSKALAWTQTTCKEMDTRIIRLPDVSDVLRMDLLRGAMLLVTPSFSEGFGLAPLEAIQNGTPAFVSDRGALPEVFGPGEWVLPLKREVWIQAIVRGMSDALFRGNIFEAQRELCERWSWAKSAEAAWRAIGSR